MGLNAQPVLDAAQSHAVSTGHFERVNMHEPKSSPGNGMTAAMWVQRISPAIGLSSLEKTSVRLELTLRIFQPALMQPQDAVDPRVLAAVSDLMTLYSGDFELGGLVMQVDLLGAYGTPLGCVAGYVTIGNTPYRVMDITLPLILDDVFQQEA